eukprot:CAMPEP_0174253526 /NCGR_PEP_ID=MMETSP0439-20130205/2886_1 /TAXON_ID=0 /ORGANISM="Stereomyxa ramosa, Strain Chinc5" /LENGTH=980 /DNA_ID=CAMNT_0015334585 /DNA_START=11 /DNA_END=2953 /DNA_ORIENTATION=-
MLDDDVSSSSGDEPEISQKEIEDLKAFVENNPKNYEAHQKLIEGLRQQGDLDEVAKARRVMAEIFPLPEEDWIRWIEEEENLASTESDLQKVQELYAKSVEDYLSVRLWERYLSFLEESDKPEEVRKVYEQAVTKAGYHTLEGASLWAAYRSFETAQNRPENVRKLYLRQLKIPLVGIEEVYEEYTTWAAEHAPPDENTEQKEKKIKAIFEKSLNRLTDRLRFEEKLKEEAEKQGSSGETSGKLEAWKGYISHEETRGSKEEVTCLYERALKEFFLVADLWLQYLAYLHSMVAPDQPLVLVSACARSVRNCFWSSELWVRYLHSMLLAGKPFDVVNSSVCGVVLSIPFSSAHDYLKIFEAICDFLFRHYLSSTASVEEEGMETDEEAAKTELRSRFQESIDFLNTYFPNSPDTFKLMRQWGRLEFLHLGDKERAIFLWEEVLKRESTGTLWIEYIHLIKQGGVGDTSATLSKCREVFKQACGSVSDSLERLIESWLAFEQEEGTLEDYVRARDYVAASRQYLAAQQELQQQQDEAKKQPKKQRTQRRPKGKPNKRPTKRRKGAKNDNNKNKQKKNAGDGNFKKPAPKKQQSASTEEESKLIGKKRPAPSGTLTPTKDDNTKRRKTEHPEQQSQAQAEGKSGVDVMEVEMKEAGDGGKEELEEGSQQEKQQKGEQQKQENTSNTVFIGNLPYSVDEVQLEAFFSENGVLLTNLRVVRNKDGVSKGFAFAETLEENGIQNIFKDKRNIQMEMSGRRIFIQPGKMYDINKQKGEVKNRTYTDKYTCFVSNLSFKTTEQDLQAFFGGCGNIQSIRLIKDKRQRSKGYAYVQCADQQTLDSALELSGKMLNNWAISVAKSNPPKGRGNNNEDNRTTKQTRESSFSRPHSHFAPKRGGSATSAPVVFSKRPASSLVPRIVKKSKLQVSPSPPSSSSSSASSTTTSTTTSSTTTSTPSSTSSSTTSTSSSSSSTGKSNAYFKTLYKS